MSQSKMPHRQGEELFLSNVLENIPITRSVSWPGFERKVFPDKVETGF